jgi:hypothetical protein
VINPPLIGNEVHNKDGAYELNAEAITDWFIRSFNLTLNLKNKAG